MSVADLIAQIPKAELHLHIEGTFEPELIFSIAQRNNVSLPFSSVEALRKAYEFEDLQSFLDLYYAGMNVLQNEQDFHDLAQAYLRRAQSDKIVHAELFFDPQAHISRGISFDTVINGLWSAVSKSEETFGITTRLIMCFLRDMSEESAMATLELALKHKDKIVAVGLDSAERNNPPSKFQKVFARALSEGFLTVAHAGEEGPPSYVVEALDLLKVSRIDHGVASLKDPKLVERLKKEQVPLTVCPLSNIKLCVFKSMKEHNLKEMLRLGLKVTVNSDDPAYFGGYVNGNFLAAATALALEPDDILKLVENSFDASFISEELRAKYKKQARAVLSSSLAK